MNREDWVRRTEREEDDDVEDEIDGISQSDIDAAVQALDVLNYILTPQFSSAANVLLGTAGARADDDEERRLLQEAFRTLPYARHVMRPRRASSSTSLLLRPMNAQSRKRLREMR